MAKNTNPHVSAGKKARGATEYGFLTSGAVSRSPSEQNQGNPSVVMQEGANPADSIQPVLQPVHGDYYIPPTGLPVVSAPYERNNYAVIAAETPDTPVPTLNPGERIISHPLSTAHVKFNEDGTLDIVGDATVRINGGDQGAVTNVEIASTNSEGGATSLDITRNDNILI